MMLTPFTSENEVDYKALEELVEWYIREGVDGLFAVCLSSEMFYLSRAESVAIAEFVVKKAAGRVPVVASGHISDEIEEQIEELRQIAATGVDAVILLTNRMAKEAESDDIWIKNTERILQELPEDVNLGLYECPYPYKRLLSEKIMKWCVETKRFYFLKDTSCDIENIKMKLNICRGTQLGLYNANTSTLLESLREGACGYSGVMANMHPRLYQTLCSGYQSRNAEKLSEFLTVCSWAALQCYPSNAKYYLQLEGLKIELYSRQMDFRKLTETLKGEIRMLRDLSEDAKAAVLQEVTSL